MLVLLVFALSTLDLAFNYTFSRIVDRATLFTQGKMALEAFDQFLLLAFAALLAIPAIRGLGRWLYLGSINRLESRLIADIKRYFFDHLLSLSHGFHCSNKTVDRRCAPRID